MVVEWKTYAYRMVYIDVLGDNHLLLYEVAVVAVVVAVVFVVVAVIVVVVVVVVLVAAVVVVCDVEQLIVVVVAHIQDMIVDMMDSLCVALVFEDVDVAAGMM